MRGFVFGRGAPENETPAPRRCKANGDWASFMTNGPKFVHMHGSIGVARRLVQPANI